MNVLNLLRTALRSIIADEKGATAVEYGLIVFGISVAIAVIVGTIGTDLFNLFTTVDTHLKAAPV